MDIKFNVSAKTARLIGRENIADVDGAVIELVKNAYDADASCCLIKFDIPFPNINLAYDPLLIKSFLKQSEYERLLEFCIEKDNVVVKKENLTIEQEAELEKILFAYNRIIIADNGLGMTKNILETAWMNIGTDNKEKDYSSKKGRIKTGAKGIGRFALDKLATSSLVFTKNEKDTLYKWSLDWNDFEKVKLLNEVVAHLEVEDTCTLQDIIKKEFADEREEFSSYKWETGTIIILNPLREQWNERLFSKVIKNMSSLNPLNSVDKFDVHLYNKYFSKFNANQKSSEINRDDYDYRLSVAFDGKEDILLKLDRNEVDITLNTIRVTNDGGDKTYELNLEEFWGRDKFKLDNYRKVDYNKEICFKYAPSDFYDNAEDRVNFSKIGSFTFDLYFLKADNSTIEIIKRIHPRLRKEILLNSGVKIYRDNFKVRPYGDEGPLYDWINLSKRSQLSPAAVTHPTGSWRVEPYQVIGNLKISRIENPRLEDMANREAIALNDTYYLLVDFLKRAIEKFEYDRQYVLREFAKWKKEEINKREPLKDKIIASSKRKREDNNKRDNDEKFTSEQYEDVINNLTAEDENEINAKQLLMMFSSSGIMANTFSHELQRISTDLGSRIQRLRSSIKRIIPPDEYSGDPDFNPYMHLDKYEKTDELLSSWMQVIMDGIEGESLYKNVVDLSDCIKQVLDKWQPLLSMKHINVLYEKKDKILYNFAVADIYIILNNFLLNSAWFLSDSNDRKIMIELTEDEKNINVTLKNNGAKLDEKYRYNPYKIFDIGETSKYKTDSSGREKKVGTGIGLWIVSQSVNKYSGQIELIENFDGFGFIIKLPRS